MLYVVVSVGDTETTPEVLPHELNWSLVHETAPVDLHEMVVDMPAVMLVGDADISALRTATVA